MKSLIPFCLAIALILGTGCTKRDPVLVETKTTTIVVPSPTPHAKHGIFEKAGEKIDQGLHKTGEGLEKAGDKIDEGFDKAGEKLKGE